MMREEDSDLRVRVQVTQRSIMGPMRMTNNTHTEGAQTDDILPLKRALNSKEEKIERISSRNYTLKIRDYSDYLPISQRYSRIIKEKFSIDSSQNLKINVK